MMQQTRSGSLGPFQQSTETDLDLTASAPSNQSIPLQSFWLEQAANHAVAAQARGYAVGLAITANPLGVRVVARKKHNGHLAEALKTIDLCRIAETNGRQLLVTIEELIAEIESYLFGQDYLPSIQANLKKSVENACRFFYENLDIGIKPPNVRRDWADYADSWPDEADAVRRAMKAAMRGARVNDGSATQRAAENRAST